MLYITAYIAENFTNFNISGNTVYIDENLNQECLSDLILKRLEEPPVARFRAGKRSFRKIDRFSHHYWGKKISQREMIM